MATQTATDSAPNDISLTLEDVAHFADATGELPGDTAVRLQALVRCNDPEQVQHTWRLIGDHLEALHRMAGDAGVELLVDAVFAFRILERLRSESWESPMDVLHPGIEVPYQQLIALVAAQAERADGAESAELLQLRERLIAALGKQLGGEKFIESLMAGLLGVGEEVAEETLNQLVGMYRERRAGAAG